MSTYKALLSVFSKDRVGLISLLTGHLFDKGINLGDTSFAILGKGGEFTSVIEIPQELSEQELVQELASLDGMADADIDIRRFAFEEAETPPTQITHHIRCEGQDQPGLLARLTEVFIDFDANIVRLKSDQVVQNGETRFITLFSVYIPAERVESCLAALGNTAIPLGQMLTFEAAG
ncbi:MAG: amino acid-binding protein [Sneathiella sp.]|jgi:glycine cleavage system transcriptional repressor|uniref:glycine cleavage system protein R n=1 Tax=Sneathiella sp. TaxID=1964365 RepID=UPI000C6A53D3|nr:ACT domain-containing protein [Sneathiella sp.]MAL78998.1 amino acid-binding protein [Sneathiella sp.]